MSRRKPQAAAVRRVRPAEEEQQQEEERAPFNPDIYRRALKRMPQPPPGLQYETFWTFRSRIMLQYVYGSGETIPSLEALFPREKRPNAPLTRAHFADMLCHWTLHYKSDLDRFQSDIIALANAGAELNNLGVRIGPSTIPGAGMGLFATRAFRVGESITAYGGYYASVDFFEILDIPGLRDYVIAIPPEFGGGIRDARVGFRLCDMGRWSNSASDDKKNAWTFIIEGSSPPAFEVGAARDIAAGEEILWDYGQHMRFDQKPVECSICTRLAALTMCGACAEPVCGPACQQQHFCSSTSK